uniref:Ycf80 n=1 Tax=Polysiphonia infestans TaxID=2006978 RepID=A0A1Z1ME77_9FLOR|nr:hypothetical protein [Polysiphonia infestans]ARW64330.1 hypothetical protein [Polysiphonia infestans]
MILSNFILFFVYQKKQSTNFLLRQRNQITYNMVLRNRSINCNQSLFAISNQDVENSSELYSSNKFDNKLISRNLWQKLTNKYLQETIFLSYANDFSFNYLNKLKKMGLSVYDSTQHRFFLYKFSKDLIDGKININHKNHNDLLVNGLENKKNVYVKYTWLKKFNLNRFNFQYKIPKTVNHYRFPVINNSLPFFVLVNTANEIIMSESVNELSKSLNHTRFHKSLNTNFSNLNNNKNTYACLLFVNYEDAVEYKNDIMYKNRKSTRSLDIEIIPSNMNLYYRLKQSYQDHVDFRVIPDLNEIRYLTNKYSRYRHVSFHNKQKYGYGFFQGQPLYQIKSPDINYNTKKVLESKDLFFFRDLKKYSNLNTYFLNYTTAMNAWQQLVKENSALKLTKDPQILVSNLEFFIEDKQNTKFSNDLIFLPSLKNYIFLKQYLQCSFKDPYRSQSWFVNQSTYLKTLCHRIFWSLTSKQLSNW